MEQRLHQTLIKVNQEYFNKIDLPEIKISKGQDKVQRRAIVFGTYNAKRNQIRIHPILLREDIPNIALEFVIYHEMLHFEDRDQLLARKKGALVHSNAFKQREKEYFAYDKAQEILKKILYGEEMSKSLVSVPSSQKSTKRLIGKELEDALTVSLQRLEQVLIKYNMIEEKKTGVKNGNKKKNDQSKLVGDV